MAAFGSVPHLQAARQLATQVLWCTSYLANDIDSSTEAGESDYQYAKHILVERPCHNINLCYSVKPTNFLFIFSLSPFPFSFSQLTWPHKVSEGGGHCSPTHPPPSASPWKTWQRVSSKASSLPESQPNSPACHMEPAKEAPNEPPHWHGLELSER